MKISNITFSKQTESQSQIVIEWEENLETVLLFTSHYPLLCEDYYRKAIEDLFQQHDFKSTSELYGLFVWWFARAGLEYPITIANFSTEERKRVGALLKDIRKKKNMKASELAVLTDIDAANISRIENGKYSPGLDVLSKIANALGYKIDFTEM